MMAKKGDAVFSTDQYIPNSVKSLERQRRGTSEKLIIKGEATKKPPDWKQFLSNHQNKKQFIQLLQKMWSKDEYAAKFQGRQVTLICDGQACLLTSTDGRTTEKSDIPTLTSSQEETDSRIILYCEYGKTKNYRHLRIKSPDSDVFYILLHYAASLEDVTVLFDTGTGNKQRLVNISELAQDYTPEHCTAIMALHAFSGCDTTSAFKGIGKVKHVKILLKMPRYIPVLAKLGDSWDVSDDLINDLDAFTCALYGRPRVAKVDDLRLIRINELCAKSNLLTSSKNVDMGTLPPCRRSLVQHILRVNYQIAIWKRAHIAMPHIPDATDGHGWTLVHDNMEPLWYDGEILPQQLGDIVNETTDSSDEDTDSDGDDPLPQDEECSVDDDDTDSDLG